MKGKTRYNEEEDEDEEKNTMSACDRSVCYYIDMRKNNSKNVVH